MFFLYNSCESLLVWIGKSSLREELRSNSTKHSQEFYFMRLPRNLRLAARNDDLVSNIKIVPV